MMKKQIVNLIIAVVVLLAIGGIIGFLTTNDIEVFGHKIRAIKGYSKTLSDLVKNENDFEVSANTQKTKISELEQAKKSFEVEKNKYEKITDNTIDIIKNSTKKEKYSLEYLWVRLGQYAGKYNLKIALVEPGNVEKLPEKEEGKGPEEKEEADDSEIPAVGEKPLEPPKLDTNKEDKEEKKEELKSNKDNYRIRAVGGYDKIADFVYAIETDETLRFKLDNIQMKAIEESNNVEALFEIRNLDIIK